MLRSIQQNLCIPPSSVRFRLLVVLSEVAQIGAYSRRYLMRGGLMSLLGAFHFEEVDK